MTIGEIGGKFKIEKFKGKFEWKGLNELIF
jgi:hypothetical protein